MLLVSHIRNRTANAVRSTLRQTGWSKSAPMQTGAIAFFCASFPANHPKKRADERTRTADLPQLRAINRVLQGLARVCRSLYPSGFLFLRLPCVAPYCARGGVGVVSTSPSYPR